MNSKHYNESSILNEVQNFFNGISDKLGNESDIYDGPIKCVKVTSKKEKRKKRAAKQSRKTSRK